MVHSDSDLILHNSSVLIDKEPFLFLAYRFAHKKANEPYESQARLLFKLLQLKIRSQLSE
ncbi:hypothetical protein EXW02_09345 [Enterococcus faecium]|nr:hypothetical protein [Enterococcus faecium]